MASHEIGRPAARSGENRFGDISTARRAKRGPDAQIGCENAFFGRLFAVQDTKFEGGDRFVRCHEAGGVAVECIVVRDDNLGGAWAMERLKRQIAPGLAEVSLI